MKRGHTPANALPPRLASAAAVPSRLPPIATTPAAGDAITFDGSTIRVPA